MHSADLSQTLNVTGEHHGSRLDQFVTALLPEHSRSEIQRLIRDGNVRLNRKQVRSSHSVHSGDIVDLTIPPPAPAIPVAEALPLAIIHDDSDLVVVNKPAGMVVHPAAGHKQGTLVNALLHHVTGLSGIGGVQRPGIVHRLDRGTSGVMVIAKNDSAHNELSRQFADRKVDKEYIALVWGLLNTGRRIDTPLGRDPVNRQKISTRARRARSAVTRVTGSERLRGLTLATIAIATGRTHQIRVHLNSIGHPVVGDSVYGGVRRHLAGDHSILKTLERPFLHAWHIAFSHPRDGRKVAFRVPLPDDLQSILTELRAWHDRDDRHE
ncbi:MAG: RNA pseudouridine synthase [Acidobacteria bacterium]|nr:RNA pseudouridine synthase [Acidobacteriota bacterium]|tara:strand:+ start:441 stop:1412 length:972 start_codon:yes stop_codon:yes gene_type:complete